MRALSEGHLAWGLTKEKHAEIDAELSDHLCCLQGAEGAPAVEVAKARINAPDGRRKLTGPHLAEQVAGTLNRWPTRQEWRELFVLLAWFALIFVSDALSIWAGKQHRLGSNFWDYLQHAPASFVWGSTAAWVLQAIARAGFFTSFIGCLVRAWQVGRGVCLARVLQLKLIHTVLVVITLYSLGPKLWNSWFDADPFQIAGPTWLTYYPLLAVGLLLSLVVAAWSRRRFWQLALGIAICTSFLLPAAPTHVYQCYLTQPLAYERRPGGTNGSDLVPSSDTTKISKSAERVAKYHDVTSINVAGNCYTSRQPVIDPPAFHAFSESEMFLLANLRSNSQDKSWLSYRLEPGGITVPLSAPGGGLGWLAFPIPILGLVGLVAMALIMGRRGWTEAVLYTVLCFIAIVSTILPFTFASGDFGSETFDFSPLAVLHSPVPGFESLLIGSNMADSGLLIFGLVLSAGVPWLVTGLFLRPRKSGLPPRATEAE